jgi:hypothetical protein
VLQGEDDSSIVGRIKDAYSISGTAKLKWWANKFVFWIAQFVDSSQVASFCWSSVLTRLQFLQYGEHCVALHCGLQKERTVPQEDIKRYLQNPQIEHPYDGRRLASLDVEKLIDRDGVRLIIAVSFTFFGLDLLKIFLALLAICASTVAHLFGPERMNSLSLLTLFIPALWVIWIRIRMGWGYTLLTLGLVFIMIILCLCEYSRLFGDCICGDETVIKIWQSLLTLVRD